MTEGLLRDANKYEGVLSPALLPGEPGHVARLVMKIAALQRQQGAADGTGAPVGLSTCTALAP